MLWVIMVIQLANKGYCKMARARPKNMFNDIVALVYDEAIVILTSLDLVYRAVPFRIISVFDALSIFGGDR